VPVAAVPRGAGPDAVLEALAGIAAL